MHNNIRQLSLSSINVDPDENCFYKAIANITTGRQSKHIDKCQTGTSFIENRGNILGDLKQHTKFYFTKYNVALCLSGNYKFIGKETTIAIAELYNCEVNVHSVLSQPLI